MNNELNTPRTMLARRHCGGRYALCTFILILALLALYPLYNRLMADLHYLRADNSIREKLYGMAAERLKKADAYRHNDYLVKKKQGELFYKLAALKKAAREAYTLTLRSRDAYVAATRLNPLDAEAAYGRARAESRLEQLYPFINSGNRKTPYQPFDWFREAVRLRPNSITFRYAMVYYLYRTGNNNDLLSIVRTLVRVYPPAYYNLRKDAFWSPAVKKSVREGLDRAIEQKISLKDAHRAMSHMAAQEKEWETAIRHYTQALQYRTFENSANDFIHLGSLYLKNKELEKAEAGFIKGLDKSRYREKDLERIFRIFRKEKDLEGFTHFYKQVGNRFITTPSMDILHARAFIDRKEYEHAKETLLAINKRAPEASAYYWLSRIAEAEKEWDIMDLGIQKATVLDPRNSEYHYRFSSVLKRLKKFERAEKEATLAIKYRAKNPSLWLFNHRGWIRWARKDYEGAAKDWKAAISLKPDSAAFHAQTAEAYARLAYWPMAEDYYKKAIKLDPKNKRYKERYNAIRK
ncbi:MAG: hypothetical protein JRJ06_01620 [Deltaproteobacteria bacterium]|nr:hypothetical protein [Deltaproteobacteria bacterium]